MAGVNVPSLGDAISGTKNGAIIRIEVTTGARQDAFPAGYNGWRKTIGCQVMAHAVENRANQAVVAIIAQTLDLPKRAVFIEAGTTSQIKKVLIKGMSKPDLLFRIQSLIQS
jgi:uncharacterized protein (TIGR00251 family)